MLTVSRHVDISNALGLHLRAADKFVRLASQFRADVRVIRDGNKANGKSILDLVTLAAESGCRLHVETNGPDSQAALDALTGLIDRGFDEDQPGMHSPAPLYAALNLTPDRLTSNPSGDTQAMGFDGGLGSSPDSCCVAIRELLGERRVTDAAAPTASTKARILVVDDDKDTAETLACLLKHSGHDARVALNGYQAIEVARHERPDFVLLDLGLPGLDGYQVAMRLRQERADALVIIAISGYGRESDRLRSREAGIDHHMNKPPDFPALLSLLSPSQVGLPRR
jgi:phosphotransferase system HPr (HPr) family protein